MSKHKLVKFEKVVVSIYLFILYLVLVMDTLIELDWVEL